MRLLFKCFSFSRFLLGIIFKEGWDLTRQEQRKNQEIKYLGSWEQQELFLQNWYSFTHDVRNSLLLSF